MLLSINAQMHSSQLPRVVVWRALDLACSRLLPEARLIAVREVIASPSRAFVQLCVLPVCLFIKDSSTEGCHLVLPLTGYAIKDQVILVPHTSLLWRSDAVVLCAQPCRVSQQQSGVGRVIKVRYLVLGTSTLGHCAECQVL